MKSRPKSELLLSEKIIKQLLSDRLFIKRALDAEVILKDNLLNFHFFKFAPSMQSGLLGSPVEFYERIFTEIGRSGKNIAQRSADEIDAAVFIRQILRTFRMRLILVSYLQEAASTCSAGC